VCRKRREFATYTFAKEDNVWLYITATSFTFCDLFPLHVVSHLLMLIFLFAGDASLIRKTSVSLDDFVLRDTCPTLECVDILSKASVEATLLREETYERVRQRWAEFSWV